MALDAFASHPAGYVSSANAEGEGTTTLAANSRSPLMSEVGGCVGGAAGMGCRDGLGEARMLPAGWARTARRSITASAGCPA